jgi:soluble lytic murein transglycosylase-like protein
MYWEKDVVISIKNDNLRQIAGIDEINSIKSKLTAVNSQNTFSDLLQNCLRETAISTPNGALQPLDKEQVALLVKSIQIQMNRQLFNVVFNNGEENNLFPSRNLSYYTQKTTFPLIEASKNRQVAPKNDVKQSGFNLDTFIDKAARKYEVDPDLIRSVIKAESNFDSQATSSKGAMGLMQLMPETANDLGVKNAYDPEENIMGGTRYLKSLLERYHGKTELALAAYNWGMGNVERNPHQLPKETSTYIARINGYYKNLKASV